MIDETVYHEYANWKLEHSELLEQMSKSEVQFYLDSNTF